MNILLIDNDLKYLNFLKQELKIFSNQIVSFSDPENALKTIGKYDYKLVIIDFNISSINSMTLFKKIKEINKNTDVIITVFPFDLRSKSIALKNGVNAFYSKLEFQMISREVEIIKINNNFNRVKKK